MTERTSAFDFPAFKDAFERKDAKRWAGFYAEDAEWIEYKPSAPSIAGFLASLEGSGIEITLSDEVLGKERAAFSVEVTLPDGRRVLEHTIVHIENGKIACQVDVEAWD